MPEHEITRFPPILQLVGLGILGSFVLLSIVGRLSPRFAWLWRDGEERNTFAHLLEYTIVPALVFASATAAAAYNWNAAVPLDGGWPASDLILGPGAALLGGFFAVAATVLGKGADAADPSAPRAWLPLVLLLSGLGLMSIGVFTLARTLKGQGGVRRSEWHPSCSCFWLSGSDGKNRPDRPGRSSLRI